MTQPDFLGRDPTDGASEKCWRAMARVDEDGEFVVKKDGKVLGSAIGCRILTGPFRDCDVVAKIATELGSGYKSNGRIKPGSDIMIDLLDGTPRGVCIATHSVPGGLETPMPGAIAGIDISDADKKGEAQTIAPGKGIGVRFYVQGAAFCVRLKGKKAGFAGECYIEADDGTLIHLRRNDSTGKFLVMLRDGDGASHEVHDGKVISTSADGSSMISVENGKIKITTDELQVNAKIQNYAGLILHNVPPGSAGPALVPMAALRGPAGPAGQPSVGTFIGV